MNYYYFIIKPICMSQGSHLVEQEAQIPGYLALVPMSTPADFFLMLLKLYAFLIYEIMYLLCVNENIVLY